MVKRLIYIITLLILAVQPAASIDVPDWVVDFIGYDEEAWLTDNHYKSFTFQYASYDGKKNKQILSARVYYSNKLEENLEFKDYDENGMLTVTYAPRTIDHIILACHPTVTTNLAVPTGPNQVDKQIWRLVHYGAESTIIVCPDYCGYGISSHLQHPYIINDVTARNCIDAVMAVFDEIPKHIASHVKLNDRYYKTDIVGYSQGGATALACAKYLESDACPSDIKQKFRLWQTTCGDGPYSAIATVKQYLDWGKPNEANMDLDYACVLPLIVAAAKDAYNEGCMRTVEVKDYFSDEFWSSGVMDLIKTKSFDTGVLDREIGKVMKRQRPVDVFSDKIIDKQTGEFNTQTKEYKCLMRALELGDLTKGWKPTHPIYFYHLKCDKTVPYANLKAVFDKDNNGIGYLYNDLVKEVDPQVTHENVKPVIRWDQNLLNIDFNNVSHSDGGTLFYLGYMFTSNLRKW